MRKLLFILMLLPAILFGQTNQPTHETIKIEKAATEMGCDNFSCTESTANIMVGGRIIQNNDTISAPILLKAGEIDIANNGEKDTILCFISSIGINGVFVDWLSNGNHLPEQAIKLIRNASEQGNFGFYISKVCYESPDGKMYLIKNTMLKVIGDKQPPPPIDTTNKWVSKFSVSVKGLSKGKISKKDLLNTKQIDVTGPSDSIIVISYDLTVQQNSRGMYMQQNNNDYSASANSTSNELTKDMFIIIKKAPRNSSLIISNIRFRSGNKDYELKKSINLLIE